MCRIAGRFQSVLSRRVGANANNDGKSLSQFWGLKKSETVDSILERYGVFNFTSGGDGGS